MLIPLQQNSRIERAAVIVLLVEAGDDSSPNPPLYHNNKTKTAALSVRLSLFCWWKRVDSDHRSETQQIYSLPPLATRERFRILS